MKAQARILAALEEAPATTREVAEITGVPFRVCATHLSAMKKTGLLGKRLVVSEVVVRKRLSLWAINQPAAMRGTGGKGEG